MISQNNVTSNTTAKESKGNGYISVIEKYHPLLNHTDEPPALLSRPQSESTVSPSSSPIAAPTFLSEYTLTNSQYGSDNRSINSISPSSPSTSPTLKPTSSWGGAGSREFYVHDGRYFGSTDLVSSDGSNEKTPFFLPIAGAVAGVILVVSIIIFAMSQFFEYGCGSSDDEKDSLPDEFQIDPTHIETKPVFDMEDIEAFLRKYNLGISPKESTNNNSNVNVNVTGEVNQDFPNAHSQQNINQSSMMNTINGTAPPATGVNENYQTSNFQVPKVPQQQNNDFQETTISNAAYGGMPPQLQPLNGKQDTADNVGGNFYEQSQSQLNSNGMLGVQEEDHYPNSNIYTRNIHSSTGPQHFNNNNLQMNNTIGYSSRPQSYGSNIQQNHSTYNQSFQQQVARGNQVPQADGYVNEQYDGNLNPYTHCDEVEYCGYDNYGGDDTGFDALGCNNNEQEAPVKEIYI